MLKRSLIALVSIGSIVFIPWLVTRYIIFPLENLTFDPYIGDDCIRYNFYMWFWGVVLIFAAIAVPVLTIAGIRRLIRYIKYGE